MIIVTNQEIYDNLKKEKENIAIRAQDDIAKQLVHNTSLGIIPTVITIVNKKYLPSIIGDYDIEDEYRYTLESSEEDLSILGMCRLYIDEFLETLELKMYTDYDI